MKYICLTIMLLTFSSYAMHHKLFIANKTNKIIILHHNSIATNNQDKQKELLPQQINNLIQNNIYQEKKYKQWKKELHILYKKHPQEIQAIDTNLQHNINKLINKQKIYFGAAALMYGTLIPTSATLTIGSGLFTGSYLLFTVLGDISNSSFENLAHFFIGVPCASIITSAFALGTATLITLMKKNFNNLHTVNTYVNNNARFIKKLLKNKKNLEKQKE